MVKKQTAKKMSFPTLVTMLLAGVFVLGGIAGMFVYATGESVVTETYMKMVSHTEYRYGETGQIVARLVNYRGQAIAVDHCNATILYPNKTYFVNMAPMTDTGNIAGDHYYTFTTPNGPEGVYEYQATCFYTVGSVQRNKSVTNSFHLSGAFNSIQQNITLIQNNLTQLSSDLASVNASLAGKIDDLSSQLNTNISTVLTQLDNISDKIDDINVSVNLTEVLDNIAQLNNSMDANFTEVFNQFSIVGTKLDAMNVTITDTNTRVQNMQSMLDYINQTTTNTYDYLTGTLTTKVDTILSDLGVINATVNRIETVSNQINSTVNQILQNQEDAVQMSVYSG